MQKHHSLVQAEKILRLVLKDPFVKVSTSYAIIKSYQNGREQGLQITDRAGKYLWAISFSENRNSDQIVIYVGPEADKGISEDAFHNRVCVDYSRPKEAVEYIINLLKLIYCDFKQLPRLINHEYSFVREISKSRMAG